MQTTPHDGSSSVSSNIVTAGFLDDPALAFALAMTVGVLAQALARRIALPGIVVLLSAGVLLGPDGANVIRPAVLGPGLPIIVGLAVAVILFEGGMSLKLGTLREQARPIQRLVTIGAFVTATGGALAAWAIMGWSLRLSILFGTLVIVTGPTVITPLLRRIRVKERVSTILEAEGIFIDAVGATIAVVTLEIAVAPTRAAVGVLGAFLRIGTGAGIGLVLGALLALALRRRTIPSGLENIASLAFAVLAFAASNALVHESGITAAIVAGLVVGNVRSRAVTHIAEFKEQLTILWIATLFVLLAADVRLADVEALGWRGVITVGALILLVRPATVWVSTRRTELEVREKLFLSWLAPRGIVAAAVASLFAIELERVGLSGGAELRALVFLVIAITVTLQGLSGGFVAKLLGLKRASNMGFLLLGAHRVAIAIGEILRDSGERVTLLDTNPELCAVARDAGLDARCANALEESTLASAAAESYAMCIGLTGNEKLNLLFVRTIRESFRGPRLVVALDVGQGGISPAAIRDEGAEVLFARRYPLPRWITLARDGQLVVERWCVDQEPRASGNLVDALGAIEEVLPLVLLRRDHAQVFHGGLSLTKGDVLAIAFDARTAATARERLRSLHLMPAGAVGDAADAPRSTARK